MSPPLGEFHDRFGFQPILRDWVSTRWLPGLNLHLTVFAQASHRCGAQSGSWTNSSSRWRIRSCGTKAVLALQPSPCPPCPPCPRAWRDGRGIKTRSAGAKQLRRRNQRPGGGGSGDGKRLKRTAAAIRAINRCGQGEASFESKAVLEMPQSMSVRVISYPVMVNDVTERAWCKNKLSKNHGFAWDFYLPDASFAKALVAQHPLLSSPKSDGQVARLPKLLR